MNWQTELQTLQSEDRILQEKLHLARTMQPRQRLLNLEKEITADRKRVAELRSLAYDTGVRNKPGIERLKLETARLINESISIDNESVILELSLRPKQQELTELRQQIEADKNFYNGDSLKKGY
jgi:type IV secretory pathway VirD2 relaxase